MYSDPMQGDDDLVIVMTTLPDQGMATRLSQILVEEHHAACVQVFPGLISTYFWQGEICTESEFLLMIKTLLRNYDALEARLRSLHPYSEPEIIAVPVIAASQGYLRWAIHSLNRERS
ncbi:divalent-cation tolerance protein CutA [Tumidithrix elongata RA019]|uniref:Divalent-cation tolerance protein CutA n=1 Tax=Tumidithrix elongata BACA0141 TaxID=2716417 RepID=A0AAW9PPS0_9CYAN|nr:divalent-cation tolerance protein CutA [Tumidithrix elongata RA019]